MTERLTRERTPTDKAASLGPHPIGTPRHGLASTTGVLAAAAWLADREITPDGERWFVEVVLGATDRTRDARFQLEVYSEEWGFQVHHDSATSWIRVTDVPFIHGRDDHGLIAKVPNLREIERFIRELELRFDIRFDREAAQIRTTITTAEPALRAWLASL